MRISVLIVTKNRASLVALCLESVLMQSDLPYEIVIVDGSDRENIAIRYLQLPQKTRSIYLFRRGIGLPQARNLAVRQAQGDVILFLDDDCRLLPHTLTYIKKVFMKGAIDVVVGKIINGNPNSVTACVQQTYYDRWVEENIQDCTRPRQMKKGFIFGMDMTVLRRTILLRNPFCEDFPFGFDEDIEIGNRLQKTGNGIYFDPIIIALHENRVTLLALVKRNYQTGYANEYIKIHYGIDVRKTPYRVSQKVFLKLIYQNTIHLTPLCRILYCIVFMICPLFSGCGRFIYRIQHIIKHSA